MDTTHPGDARQVREFACTTPFADFVLADIGEAAALNPAEADARDRLAEHGRYDVLTITQEWVRMLPGHTLGGFDPETGEPLGPPGRIVHTRLRVVERAHD